MSTRRRTLANKEDSFPASKKAKQIVEFLDHGTSSIIKMVIKEEPPSMFSFIDVNNPESTADDTNTQRIVSNSPSDSTFSDSDSKHGNSASEDNSVVNASVSPDISNGNERKCFQKFIDKGLFGYTNLPTTGNSIVLQCLVCLNNISNSTTTNSNILRHMKKKHFDLYSDLPEIQNHIREPTAAPKKIIQDENYWNQQLAQMAIENYLPVSIFDSEIFKKILHEYPKNAKAPCSKTVTNVMSGMINQMKEKLIKTFDKIDYFCGTADFWSVHKKLYLGVTVHWIDHTTLERKHAAISCKNIPVNYTPDTIVRKLQSVFAEYGITEKVLEIVTDNASNFPDTFNNCGSDKDENNQIIFNPINLSDMKIQRTGLPKVRRCVAHTLNLILTKDSEAALLDEKYRIMHNNVLGKLKEYWNKQCESILGEFLKTPNSVRWHTMYLALTDISSKSLIDLNKLLQDFNTNRAISETEYQFIKEYIKIMEPITNALNVLKEESYMYLAFYTPTIYRILNKLNLICNLVYCGPLREALLIGINTRFTDINSSFNLKAAILHPFHKNFINKYDVNNQKNSILNLLAEELSTQNQTAICVTNKTKINYSYGEKFFVDDDDDDDCTEGGYNIQQEYVHLLNTYLSDITNIKFNIFNNFQDRYYKIKNLFIKYNTVIPTSAVAEILFNTAKNIIRAKSDNLTSEHFEQNLLLNINKD